MSSSYPSSNNKTKARDVVRERKKYAKLANQRIEEQYSIDFWYGNKTYYGKIDTKENAVFPVESFLKAPISQPDKRLFAPVADAYDDFYNFIQIKSQKKQIENSFFLNNLRISNGYQSVKDYYHEHMKMLYQDFVVDFLVTKKIIVKDFQDFIHHFQNWIKSQAFDYPINLSSFIKSRYCPPTISGIVIEFGKINPDDDLSKTKNIIDNKSFNLFKESARKFGFVVDVNYPTRMVAYLQSSKMLEYILAGDLAYLNQGTTQKLFSNSFYKAHYYDGSFLRRYLTDYYNNLSVSFPYTKKVKSGGGVNNPRLRTCFHQRKPVEEQDVQRYFEPFFWELLALEVGVAEQKLTWSESKLTLVKQRARQLRKKLDTRAARDYTISKLRVT